MIDRELDIFSTFSDGLAQEILCKRCRATLSIESDCRSLINSRLAEFQKLHTKRHIAISKKSANEDINPVTQ